MTQENKNQILQGEAPGAPATWRKGWLATLAGAWLFILLGPLAAINAYPYPYPAWHDTYFVRETFTVITLASIVIGISIAIWRKFPRWCFPYLTIPLIISGLPLMLLISEVLLPGLYDSATVWGGIFQMGVMAFSWGVSTILLILVALYWRPMKPLGESLRHDYTQLSFGLFILITWLFAQIDHDEDPYLTAAVILPLIFLALGAAGYMRSRTRRQQWLSLVGSLAAAMLVRMFTGAWFYAVFALPLAMVVFLPAMLLLSNQQSIQPTVTAKD